MTYISFTLIWNQTGHTIKEKNRKIFISSLGATFNFPLKVPLFFKMIAVQAIYCPFFGERRNALARLWMSKPGGLLQDKTYCIYSKVFGHANIVHYDQMPKSVASDQRLHCLPLSQQFLHKTDSKIKLKWTCSNLRTRMVRS